MKGGIVSDTLTDATLIILFQYLVEFNSRPLEPVKLSPLFSDDARVAEAAAVALKLHKFCWHCSCCTISTIIILDEGTKHR